MVGVASGRLGSVWSDIAETRPAGTGPAPGQRQAHVLSPGIGYRHCLMHCEIRRITPEDAAELLKQNKSNRSLSKSHVKFFESQIRNGQMQTTHQGIAISQTGRLIDGQHRLTAIVNTGIAVDMLVGFGFPDESFSVLDSGKARTAGDVISAIGASHSTSLAASVRLFIAYKEYPHLLWAGGSSARRKISNTTIKEEYEKDLEGWRWASSVARSMRLPKVITPGPAGCLLYLAATDACFDRLYLETFLEKVKMGAGLTVGDPILAYRNKSLAAVARDCPQSQLADYIKLFNAYTSGQSLKIFKSQQYPPMPTLVHASESWHENAEA